MHQSNPNPIDQSDADHTAEVLAAADLASDAPSDDVETARLGSSINAAISQALPEASEALRAAVLDKLNDDSQATEVTMPPSSRLRPWIGWATVAVCVGLLVFLLTPAINASREVAHLVEPNPDMGVLSPNAVSPGTVPPNTVSPNTGAPAVRYRTEVRTREVPVTVMQTEVRTRPIPVTKTRTESRVRQVEKNGKMVEESYQVSVPYTESVAQSYTVQVPVTEMVKQSYTVQVPVNSTQTESYQVQVPVNESARTGKVVLGGAVNRDAGKSEAIVVDGESPGDRSYFEFAIEDLERDRASSRWALERKKQKTKLAEQRFDIPEAQKFVDLRSRFVVPSDATRHEAVEPYFRGVEQQRYQKHLVEDFGTEQYEVVNENEFSSTVGEGALSTFSIDVDTASYTNARRFLMDGQLPPPNSVRVEEFLNYFTYEYPQPEDDVPFAVHTEVASCPWNKKNKLLRVGLKGKEIQRDERPASNLVFLLDVSGSMQSPDKLALMKQGLKMLVKQLREDDMVSIVTYAGNAGVVLEPTSGNQSRKIIRVIESLDSGGSTHGSAGIDRAYELAAQNFVEEGTNRVILATDGDLNVGITEDDALVELIKAKAGEGVFLTVLGFGTGNLKDAKMEKLADHGNGVYAYIDSVRESHKVLVHQMSGSLVTIAKDVKLQLEFNPKRVQSYRLIGYENRALANEDFDNDKKDAGEIGAGHTVTALYELVPVGSKQSKPQVELKYQDNQVAAEETVEHSSAADSDELVTLKLRYKEPDGQKSKLIEFVCQDSKKKFAKASTDFRFASSVAAFGMILRQSKHAGDSTVEMCQEIAGDALGDDAQGYRSEFVDLVEIASELIE